MPTREGIITATYLLIFSFCVCLSVCLTDTFRILLTRFTCSCTCACLSCTTGRYTCIATNVIGQSSNEAHLSVAEAEPPVDETSYVSPDTLRRLMIRLSITFVIIYTFTPTVAVWVQL